MKHTAMRAAFEAVQLTPKTDVKLAQKVLRVARRQDSARTNARRTTKGPSK